MAQANLSRRSLEKIFSTGTSFLLHQATVVIGGVLCDGLEREKGKNKKMEKGKQTTKARIDIIHLRCVESNCLHLILL